MITFKFVGVQPLIPFFAKSQTSPCANLLSPCSLILFIFTWESAGFYIIRVLFCSDFDRFK